MYNSIGIGLVSLGELCGLAWGFGIRGLGGLALAWGLGLRGAQGFGISSFRPGFLRGSS